VCFSLVVSLFHLTPPNWCLAVCVHVRVCVDSIWYSEVLPEFIDEDTANGAAAGELKFKKDLFALLNLKYLTGAAPKPAADQTYVNGLHRKRYFTEEQLASYETNTLTTS
jgi:hypothetical protein